MLTFFHVNVLFLKFVQLMFMQQSYLLFFIPGKSQKYINLSVAWKLKRQMQD